MCDSIVLEGISFFVGCESTGGLVIGSPVRPEALSTAANKGACALEPPGRPAGGRGGFEADPLLFFTLGTTAELKYMSHVLCSPRWGSPDFVRRFTERRFTPGALRVCFFPTEPSSSPSSSALPSSASPSSASPSSASPPSASPSSASPSSSSPSSASPSGSSFASSFGLLSATCFASSPACASPFASAPASRIASCPALAICKASASTLSSSATPVTGGTAVMSPAPAAPDAWSAACTLSSLVRPRNIAMNKRTNLVRP